MLPSLEAKLFHISLCFNQSVTLSCSGGSVSFWGLQCDYVLLSLLMIDVSHRNAVKIISEIY